jgi:GntR family transcriptional regulator/MocR family aminotransferase
MGFIAVSSQSGTPLRRQIYDEYRQGILTGRFRPSERVPSTRDLAVTLSVARTTVTEAYDQLIAEGYLESARGSGTFVCSQLPQEIPPAKPRPAKHPLIRLSRYGAGIAQDVLRPSPPPGVIQFTTGTPDLREFPFALWRQMLSRHMRNVKPATFDYAADPAGDPELRAQVAAYTARIRGVRCSPEQVVIVNGSQQALDLSVRVLLERGDSVAFENPGYHAAHRIFRAHGVHLQPLSVDAEGVVLRRLKADTRMIYVTPSHQFPTGAAMSVARRLELIRMARERGTVILEDDYSSEFRYSDAPLPSLQGLSTDAAVIYMGTFSKVMFPALRIGYVIVPPQLIETFRCAKWLADRHAPGLEQAALAEFIRDGHLDRHIRRMRRVYRLRRDALLEALEKNFGASATVLGDAAGMHVMVRFEDRAVARRAVQNRVWLPSADQNYLTDPPGNEFIFGFAALTERSIREGIRRIAGLLP